MAVFLANLLIGKRFERQADEFAYKTVGKAAGHKLFFKRLIEKKDKYNKDFETIYDFLQKSKPELSTLDSTLLTVRYYLASFGNKIRRLDRWIYYNTPLGAHPSPEARIKAAEDYLARKSKA